MENALLIGLSRQVALRHQMDVVANNLANMETAGFKSESLKFEELVAQSAEAHDASGANRSVSYVRDVAAIRDFSDGDLVPTGNPFDVSVSGKGWLVVETAQGERYTRNGHMKIDAEGRLTTGDGNPVLTNAGIVTVSPEESDFSVATDGTISTSEGDKGKLRIVDFDNQDSLKKEGAALFSSSEAPRAIESPRIAQGLIEKSNVKPVAELTRMIEVSRAYISMSKMLETTSTLRQRAIQELGKLDS